MKLYDWLNGKKYSNTVIIIWSLVISYIIKIFYASIHSVVLSNININEYVKVLVYIITGALLSILITRVLRIKIFSKMLMRINNKSINDDIFDDVIDYELPTMMSIYLKNSDLYYIGRYCCREEKGLDSWIVLINYCCVNKADDEIVYDPQENEQKSVVMINLHDIERIENIYEDASKMWQYLSGETPQKNKTHAPNPRDVVDMANKITKKQKK